MGESFPDAGRDDHIVEVDHRAGRLLTEGLGRLGRLHLFLPECADLRLQPLALPLEVVGVHTGLGQGVAQLVQRSRFFIQLCGGLFNLGGFGRQPVLQGGRETLCLLDLPLDVVVLGLQQSQPLAGVFGRGLLLLIGADVGLGAFQLLDLFLGRLDGGLGRLEGPTETAAHLRIERKQKLILFAVCHRPSYFWLVSAASSLLA